MALREAEACASAAGRSPPRAAEGVEWCGLTPAPIGAYALLIRCARSARRGAAHVYRAMDFLCARVIHKGGELNALSGGADAWGWPWACQLHSQPVPDLPALRHDGRADRPGVAHALVAGRGARRTSRCRWRRWRARAFASCAVTAACLGRRHAPADRVPRRRAHHCGAAAAGVTFLGCFAAPAGHSAMGKVDDGHHAFQYYQSVDAPGRLCPGAGRRAPRTPAFPRAWLPAAPHALSTRSRAAVRAGGGQRQCHAQRPACFEAPRHHRADARDLQQRAAGAGAGFCLPETAPTLDRVAGEFVSWAAANPQYSGARAAEGVLRFAAATYPCPAAPARRRGR